MDLSFRKFSSSLILCCAISTGYTGNAKASELWLSDLNITGVSLVGVDLTAPGLSLGGAVFGQIDIDGALQGYVLDATGKITLIGYLSDPLDPSAFSQPYAASAGGFVVVGASFDGVNTQAARWTKAGGLVGLGFLGFGLGGESYSRANAVNIDGSVIVGVSFNGLFDEAFRWTASGGMTGLGILTLPGLGVGSNAVAVSADGSVVAGIAYNGLYGEAFRWTEGGGMVGLGLLSGFVGGAFSHATAISADGAVIVGSSFNGLFEQAFYQVGVGGLTSIDLLGGLLGAGGYSRALAVNASGSVIVGVEFDGSVSRAFRWTPGLGTVSIAELVFGLGLNADGLEFNTATSVSLDGSIISGLATLPNGLIDTFFYRDGAGVLMASEAYRSAAQIGAIHQGATIATFQDMTGLVDVARTLDCSGMSMKDGFIPGLCLFATGGGYSADAYDGSNVSGSAGLSRTVTPGLTIGAGVIFSSTDMDLPYRGGADIDSVGIGVFVSHRRPDSPYEVDIAAVARSLDLDINRGYLNALSPASSRGETDGASYGALLRLGYSIIHTPLRRLTPFAEFAVVSTDIDGYSEKTGPFPAKFGDISDESGRLRLGLELRGAVTTGLEGWTWAAWTHRFDDDGSGVRVNIGDFLTFNTKGIEFDNDGVEVGAGLKWGVRHDMNAFATAAGNFGADSEPEFAGRVGLSMRIAD